jgi:hypothetical protein
MGMLRVTSRDGDDAADLEAGRLMVEAALSHLTDEEQAQTDPASWVFGYAVAWLYPIARPVRAGAQLRPVPRVPGPGAAPGVEAGGKAT